MRSKQLLAGVSALVLLGVLAVGAELVKGRTTRPIRGAEAANVARPATEAPLSPPQVTSTPRRPLPPRVANGAGAALPARATIWDTVNGMNEDDIPPVIESLHASEPVTTWGRSASESLRETFRRHASDPTNVEDVDCRTDSCRVRLTFADMNQRQKYMMSMLGGREKDLGEFAVIAPRPEKGMNGGEVDATVWLFHEAP
jgi:hypothetical protein